MKDYSIVNTGGTIKFIEDGEDRSRIHDIDDGEFLLCTESVGNIFINKDDIDELIILLTAVKENGYKID
ncbi:hypothetical protein V7128_01895 [Neobacillus vireti]|uniref:hypothetical protein n=1 Tax=Neobacillus vireti TaxID=220686 RepID=UPI002FFEF2A1